MCLSQTIKIINTSEIFKGTSVNHAIIINISYTFLEELVIYTKSICTKHFNNLTEIHK